MTASIWSAQRKTTGRPGGSGDVRTPFEQDYDRLLFSTPVRRLGDKTQVFPLERNDSVRTRLTHSHEVSNIAKSLGTRLIRTDQQLFADTKESRDATPVILAAVGLAHDLGNPPFGHQGEAAISRWFKDHDFLFTRFHEDEQRQDPDFREVPVDQRLDFTDFEGNAQALRLVSRLQNTAGPAGLNLTAATLAALLKYPVPSSRRDKSKAQTKKHGYLTSELDVIEWVRSETGLSEGMRHPLTWLMEAADDAAYSVLDIEDATKKNLVSAEDLVAHLRNKFSHSDLGGLTNQLSDDFKKADAQEFSLSRVREIKSTYLRTRLLERLITGAVEGFRADAANIFGFKRTQALLECDSLESKLCSELKDFAKVHAYQNPSVLEQELQGSMVIHFLMDVMWDAISHRKSFRDTNSRRLSPRAAFVYSLMSDSYRWHFERNAAAQLTVRYRELQLLGDMVSGMTDGYAIDTYRKIKRHADA